MKSYASDGEKEFVVGDLVRYWDEWNEVYHVGVIIEEDETDTPVGKWSVFFADTIPGYLQPSTKHGRVVFSCHDSILEKI